MNASRTFRAEIHGTAYQFSLTLWAAPGPHKLGGVLNWRGGSGGGSRRLTTLTVGDDAAARIAAGLRGEMPAWAFADALREAGCEEGIADMVAATLNVA